MRNRSWTAAAALICCGILFSGYALADGEILITQAKAAAGNVTPGDAAGYPVTLSKPGLYKLAGNLAVPAGKAGLQITSAFVTIDLNGFALQGGGVAGIGISGSNNQGITIQNGTIARFKTYGILGNGDYWVVENMRVVKTGGGGISLSGNNNDGHHARVLNNTVADNGANGVVCGINCLVQDNNISENNDFGVLLGSGIVLGNNISDNGDNGIYSSGSSGFGNNVLTGNNGGGEQISSGVYALQPNFCTPAC